MKMKSPNLKFPKTLPNDIEDYLIFFKKKFPKIIEEYEGLVKKYWNDSSGLDNYCKHLVRELWEGFEKIKREFNSHDYNSRDIDFLIKIDQKLQKLNCFRFWIINYALCEGPIHEFHAQVVSEISETLSKDEDLENQIEEKERIERILLKGDYKDLYLINSLKGIEVYEDLSKSNLMKPLFNNLKRKILDKKEKEAYKIIDEIIDISMNKEYDNPELKRFVENIKVPLKDSEIKGDHSVVYVVIIGAIEFYEKNLQLEEQFKNIKTELKLIFEMAEKKLDKERYKQLILSYKMLIKLKKFKDDFGAIDPEWLPFWLVYLLPELENKIGAPKGSCSLGPGSTFYSFPWYLKGKELELIFERDNTSFNLDKI